MSKIVTKKISDYVFSHGIIKPEQFGLRNKKECISLFISIHEICQKKDNLMINLSFLLFLTSKKKCLLLLR